MTDDRSPKPVRVYLPLPADLHGQVEALAKKGRRNKATVLLMAIEQYVESAKPDSV